MRQAGVLAAAGLVALDEGPRLLAEDHRRARELASALAERPGVRLEMDTVETNIVVFDVDDPEGWIRGLEARGVLATVVERGRVRLVTHRDVGDDGLDRAVAAIRGL
jgi:threonine aldolase